MCDELSLISSKDLKSIEDTQNLRTQYLEEITPLKAQKEIYMKLYNKTDNAADKTILKARINILNEDIERLNKKIQTCKRIINKAEKGEKEDWIIQKDFKIIKKEVRKKMPKIRLGNE